MTSRQDTLELVRKHPDCTTRELAERIAPDTMHSMMVRIVCDLGSNLSHLYKRGWVGRSGKPYRWRVAE